MSRTRRNLQHPTNNIIYTHVRREWGGGERNAT